MRESEQAQKRVIAESGDEVGDTMVANRVEVVLKCRLILFAINLGISNRKTADALVEQVSYSYKP